MKLNKIEVIGKYKQLQIQEIKDGGGFHRRVLKPDTDISSEVQEIQEKAEALWTNEVKEKWAEKLEANKAEQEANKPG